MLVFLIPAQQSFVRLMPVAHASCNYNWIRYCFFDLFFFFLMALVLPRLRIVSKEKEVRVLFGFFALCLLSIVINAYGALFLPVWSLLKLFCASLLFLALILEANRERMITSVQWTLVVSGLFQSFISLYQYFAQSSLGLKFLGEGKINPAQGLGAYFPVKIGGVSSMVVRAKGTLDSPNHLGIFLVASLVALTVLYIKGSVRVRRFLALAFFLIFFALCITFSRAALFAWALSIFVFFIFVRGQGKAMFKLFLPAILLCGALLFNQLVQRGGVISSTDVNRGADQERILYQNNAFEMIKSHPIRGVGFRNYVAVLDDYTQEVSGPLLVHNIFLLILAEEGIIGLALFLLLFAFLLWRAWPHRSSVTVAAWAAFLIGLMFYGCCDVFLLSEQQGLLLLFLVFGLLFLSTKKEVSLDGQ